MKTNFFPKVTIEGKKLIFNSEAVETMELDVEGSKVILIECAGSDSEKKKPINEVLVFKTNGSLCDDIENIKDVFPPEKIRTVALNDGIGEITVDEETLNTLVTDLGTENEFKLLVVNTESVLGKEFREQFDIQSTYYRFAGVSDKRDSIGKEKNVIKDVKTEERISIN
jgi:hypothetical protein